MLRIEKPGGFGAEISVVTAVPARGVDTPQPHSGAPSLLFGAPKSVAVDQEHPINPEHPAEPLGPGCPQSAPGTPAWLGPTARAD